MMEISQVVLQNGRNFDPLDSIVTLENGALFVAGINLATHAFLLVAVYGLAAIVLSGDKQLGCLITEKEKDKECQELTPGLMAAATGVVTLYTAPMMWLNYRLYGAIQEKDEKFITFWLQVTSVFAIGRSFLYHQADKGTWATPEVLQLWIVYEFLQSSRIDKLESVIPSTPIRIGYRY